MTSAAAVTSGGRRSFSSVVLIAVITVLGLQAIRVFTTHTVWVIGETTSREGLAVVALTGFVGAALAGPLARILGTARARTLALAVLAVAAGVGQASPWPLLDFATGLAGTLAFGWLVTLRLAGGGVAVGTGLAIGFSADLAVRAVFVTIDAPFAHGPAAATTVAAQILLLVVTGWATRGDDVGLPGWRRGWRLLAIGPGLALFMSVTGNFGQAAVRADLDFRAAALTLGAGAALGVLWTLVHAASERGATRIHALAAAAAVAVGYTLFAGRTPLGAVGIAAIGAGVPVLLAAAVSAQADTRRSAAAVTYATLSLVLFMLLLFTLYSFYQPEWVIPVAVAVLVAVALAGAFSARGLALAVRRTEPRAQTWVLAAIAVILFIPTAVSAAGVVPPSAAALPDPQRLRVMTYNIRQGFGLEGRLDLEAVARVIDEAQPDVVALQEVGRGWVISGAVDTLTWLSNRLGLPYAYGDNAGDLWGNSVLSRLPMQPHNHRFANSGRVPRGVLHVDLAMPGGPVTILNTHLDHADDGGPTRQAQVTRILEEWGGAARTIVIGDLNAEIDSPEIQQLIAAGFEDLDRSGDPTAPAGDPARRIDYVFATPDVHALGVGRPRATASDHLAVWVDLAVP